MDGRNGCLTVRAERVGKGITASAMRIGDGIRAEAFGLGEHLNVSCSLVCSIPNIRYLYAVPDVVWLSPDDLAGAEFDIYSNVVWKIDVVDVEPEEPALLYLNNETMITNDTFFKNEDVTRISSLRNETLVQNMYYFINQ